MTWRSDRSSLHKTCLLPVFGLFNSIGFRFQEIRDDQYAAYFFNVAEGSKKIVSSCQHYENWSCLLLTGKVRLVVAGRKVFCLGINYRGSGGEKLVLCYPSNSADFGLMCIITIVKIWTFVVFICVVRRCQLWWLCPVACRQDESQISWLGDERG